MVLCVHGWEGMGAQFGQIGRRLAASGYRCVAIDLTAHGQSDGRWARFADFLADIHALVDHLQQKPVAVIGHSAGGMLLMAARHQFGLTVPNSVVIASPSAPFPPVEILQDMLAPPDAVVEQLKIQIADQFGASWDRLISGYLYAHEPHGKLMLIYDESDPTVHHEQGDVIKKLWPDSQLIKTNGLGHNRVLADASVADRIAEFVGPVAATMS